MPGFLDQLGKLAQKTAADARQRANEAKLQIDIRGIAARFDERAQALGHLVFRQSQGESVADEELAKVIGEMRQAVADRKAKEAELEALRRPAPEPEPTPEPPVAPTPPTAQPASDAPEAPAAPPDQPPAPPQPKTDEEQ